MGNKTISIFVYLKKKLNIDKSSIYFLRFSDVKMNLGRV